MTTEPTTHRLLSELVRARCSPTRRTPGEERKALGAAPVHLRLDDQDLTSIPQERGAALGERYVEHASRGLIPTPRRILRGEDPADHYAGNKALNVAALKNQTRNVQVPLA